MRPHMSGPGGPGDTDTSRICVVYQADQMYPKYVITFDLSFAAARAPQAPAAAPATAAAPAAAPATLRRVGRVAFGAASPALPAAPTTPAPVLAAPGIPAAVFASTPLPPLPPGWVAFTSPRGAYWFNKERCLAGAPASAHTVWRHPGVHPPQAWPRSGGAAAAARPPAPPSQPATAVARVTPTPRLSIKICDQTGVEHGFIVNTTTQLQKLFEAYAAQAGVGTAASLCFFYRGAPVGGASAAEDLSLEDGARLDVIFAAHVRAAAERRCKAAFARAREAGADLHLYDSNWSAHESVRKST